jgi:hypothetical protein
VLSDLGCREARVTRADGIANHPLGSALISASRRPLRRVPRREFPSGARRARRRVLLVGQAGLARRPTHTAAMIGVVCAIVTADSSVSGPATRHYPFSVCMSEPCRAMPTATWPMPDHESSHERSAWSAGSCDASSTRPSLRQHAEVDRAGQSAPPPVHVIPSGLAASREVPVVGSVPFPVV